nr:epoxyalkane--coenzyme M transferase [Desulfuromonadales bacterium]
MPANRILTTHVGSLVRPDDFTAVLHRKVEGTISEQEFGVELANAVDWVVAKQAETGI